MSHPPAVCEKAQSLEQLLQRLEAGERLISVRAELGLDVKAADVQHLRAKYEASGQTWESLLDGRYGHPQTAHSALREWMYQRKRVLLHRTIGNVLIAAGALLPAFGGTFSRFGIGGALYLSEFLGAILMFIGFVRAVTPMKESDSAEAAVA